MEREPFIRVEKVGKILSYRSFSRIWRALSVGRRKKTLRSNEFWALRNVSLLIRSGERVAVLGKNGSGKTTLMKLLAGAYLPDAGSVVVRGRVGSAANGFAGVHPYLTVEENIRVRLALLGMKPSNLSVATEEVLEFAGLTEQAEAKAKMLSAGQLAKISLSAAIISKSDHYLIDEALDALDLHFQKKIRLKLAEKSAEGATVLVITHNQPDCAFFSRAIWLDRGELAFDGLTESVWQRFRGTEEPAPFIPPTSPGQRRAVSENIIGHASN